MALETATFISQLVASNPVGAVDPKSQGDDHLRLLKAVLQATLPNATHSFRFPRTTAATPGVIGVTDTFQNIVLCTQLTTTVNLINTTGLPDGWGFWVMKVDNNSQATTIVPNGTTLINGGASVVINRYLQAVRLVWNVNTGQWLAIASVPLVPGTTGLPLSMLVNSSAQNRILGAGTDQIWAEKTIGEIIEYIGGTGAVGDLLVRTAANTWARLAAGAASTWLRANGAGVVPSYATIPIPARAYAAQTGIVSTSSVIPEDDSIPQIGEGDQILSASITPVKASSIIRIKAECAGLCTTGPWALALFLNGVTDAVRAVYTHPANANGTLNALTYEFAPGSVSTITMSVRAGPMTGGASLTINANLGGTRRFGGSMAPVLTAEEWFTA